MKKSRKNQKLGLSRETLSKLLPTQISRVAAGDSEAASHCIMESYLWGCFAVTVENSYCECSP